VAGRRSSQVDARKRAFLDAFRLTANVSGASRAAGCERSTPYGWARDDPVFKAAMEEAEQEAADRLEAEAFRRAHDGYEEYVTSGGKLVRDDDGGPLLQRRYSDQLMLTLLKAHRPEKFKDRHQVEHSGEVKTIQALLDTLPDPESA
jgi:hypothetical protein